MIETIDLCDVVLCFEDATELVACPPSEPRSHYKLCAAHAALYTRWLADPFGVTRAIRAAARGWE